MEFTKRAPPTSPGSGYSQSEAEKGFLKERRKHPVVKNQAQSELWTLVWPLGCLAASKLVKNRGKITYMPLKSYQHTMEANEGTQNF